MLFKRRKRYTCTVCGQRFEPEREKIYKVTTDPTAIIMAELNKKPPTAGQRQWNVMDCPRCGCRQFLAIHDGVRLEQEGKA